MINNKLKIFIIAFIILISCNAEIKTENEKIDTTIKSNLNSFIKNLENSNQRMLNNIGESQIIDMFMQATADIELLLAYMPENRKYITLEDIQYIGDYFVTNYYVKGAKSVDEAKQYIIDRAKAENDTFYIELYKSIDDVNYHSFDSYLLKD